MLNRPHSDPDAFDLPFNPLELKIQIVDSCNLRCSFCHRRRREKHAVSPMPEEEVFEWIDWAVENGLPAVRFTGGEPTLHPKLQVFCYYARLRQRYVILNTNGLARPALYRDILPVLNDVRFSLPLLDAERLDEISGGKHILEQKMAAVRQALSSPTTHVALLTVLLPENKGKLEAFARLVRTSPKLSWFPLRQESSPDSPRPWTRADTQDFAEEMAHLMDRYPDRVRGIFLAAPFCAVSPVSLGARVFRGRTLGCGPHTGLCVSAEGRLQACYGSPPLCGRIPLGDIERSAAMRNACAIEALPPECQRCPHVARCAGGCRNPSALVAHRGGQVDYLAGFLNETSGKHCRNDGLML